MLTIMQVADNPGFFDFLPPELLAQFQNWNWPPFRAKQTLDWVYVKLVADPMQMSNLSVLDRQKLGDNIDFQLGNILRRQSSNDGTEKLLIGWPDGAQAESVMIPDGPRRTACLSSQVGCPVG